MKKKLLALAVIAASGAASAQSSVTLYGLVDIGFGSFKTNGISQTKVDGSGLATSRFGFKGREDLGGGLGVDFLLEQGFSVDTGVAAQYTSPYTGQKSTAMFNRQSYVGLSGGFGAVKLGKAFTAYDDINGNMTGGFNSNFFKATLGVWKSENDYQDRPGNIIYYATPVLNGLSGAASYSFGENKTATESAGSIGSFHVKYDQGPVFVGLAYQTEKATGSVDSTKFTNVMASYDLGVAKLMAALGRVDQGPARANEWQVGTEIPLGGSILLSAGYSHSKDNDAANTKRSGFGVAAKYALSKRTNLYAGLNNNKQTADGTADVKNATYAAGINHRF